MKRLLILFYLVGGTYFSVAAQTPVPQSTPTMLEENRNRVEREIRRDREFERLRNIKNRVSVTNMGQRQRALQNINLLYRKPTSKELEALTPNNEDVQLFSDFLRQPNTGLTRLAADKGCAESTQVVVASPDCLAYTMPGGGSSYSFRTKNYRISRLADITFTDNSFQSMGILLHGIFVKLGDISLDQVNLQTKGVDFLIKLKSEADFQKALDLDNKLITGIENDGFLYRRALRAVNNTTYLLRSIAYRGNYLRAVNGLTYDELDFDKREDVTVAFRIVRRHDDGSITILWKQLAKQSSPKTKWNKNERKNERKAVTELNLVGTNNRGNK